MVIDNYAGIHINNCHNLQLELSIKGVKILRLSSILIRFYFGIFFLILEHNLGKESFMEIQTLIGY